MNFRLVIVAVNLLLALSVLSGLLFFGAQSAGGIGVAVEYTDSAEVLDTPMSVLDI